MIIKSTIKIEVYKNLLEILHTNKKSNNFHFIINFFKTNNINYEIKEDDSKDIKLYFNILNSTIKDGMFIIKDINKL